MLKSFVKSFASEHVRSKGNQRRHGCVAPAPNVGNTSSQNTNSSVRDSVPLNELKNLRNCRPYFVLLKHYFLLGESMGDHTIMNVTMLG